MLFVNVPQYKFNILCNIAVAPFVGAWIEIHICPVCIFHKLTSLPSWERGLKYKHICQKLLHIIVAPFVGAWIEITEILQRNQMQQVAPLVGAWIEINAGGDKKGQVWSLPSWERGLKL